jgi:hypothetical protein
MLVVGLGNTRDLKKQERQQKETGKSQKGGTSTAEKAEKEFIIDANRKEYVSYISSRSNGRKSATANTMKTGAVVMCWILE